MYEYILFDLDGTLTDSKPGITTCVQYALHRMGIEEPDLDKLEPFIGPPLMDSFHDFYGFSEEQGKQATAYYRERYSVTGLFENEVYPGIDRLLEDLKAAGKKLAVASSKPQPYVERILDHFGLLTYFDVVVGSDLNGTRTKKEEVVEVALRQLLPELLFQEIMDKKHENREAESAEKAEIISNALKYDTIAMVGDRRFDMEGAKAYHIAGIGVAYGYAAPGELSKAGADVIAETVEELGKILLQQQ
ncbi:MAG: HAD hydrolase-like protein [Lachnospiraceae bacterium]|nr:HAD hydrolase-like protein [Lachnospiraceae bacterium]